MPPLPAHPILVGCGTAALVLPAQVAFGAGSVPPGSAKLAGAVFRRLVVIVDVIGGELHAAMPRQTVVCDSHGPDYLYV